MALKNINGNDGYLEELISAGSDAFTNLYYLEFTSNKLKNTLHLKVRNQDFKPPTFSQPVNNFSYMTTDFDLPKAEIQGDKKLTFNFRVDEQYEVYQSLLDQMAITSVPNLGQVSLKAPDNNDLIIKVYAANGSVSDIKDSNSGFRYLYKFEYCWVMNVKGLTYGYDSSNPEKVSVDIGFFKCETPDTRIKDFVPKSGNTGGRAGSHFVRVTL